MAKKEKLKIKYDSEYKGQKFKSNTYAEVEEHVAKALKGQGAIVVDEIPKIEEKKPAKKDKKEQKDDKKQDEKKLEKKEQKEENKENKK